MRKTVFIKNAAVITATSLILRFCGIVFKVWLAARIGAEGIGVYQLVFSVYVFASTFATSGICTAVTRLCGEELAVGSKNKIKKIVKRCIQISCVIAFFTIIVMLFGARIISEKLLHEPRATLSLKVSVFALPFMSICSCIKGYFIARRKAGLPSASQIAEQIVRIASVVCLITKYGSLGLEYTCAAVMLGDCLAEATACLMLYLVYKKDISKLNPQNNGRTNYKILPAVSHIALPITSGRYLNSLLRTAENVLVPICLTNQAANGNGISLFGMIKGMALPILFFPSVLLNALSTLLIPEISEAAVCNRLGVVRSIVNRIIKITAIISIMFSAVFFCCGNYIGKIIYNNADVGFLLHALSPIVPFMYLDSVCDGILKGLDQQKFTFRTSVSDSALRIVLILLFLKTYGINAFLGIMYFSNFFTCTLNVNRLLRVSRLKINATTVFVLPVCCAYTVCFITNILLENTLKIGEIPFVAVMCAVCVPLYLVCLFLLKIINRDDIDFIIKK